MDSEFAHTPNVFFGTGLHQYSVAFEVKSYSTLTESFTNRDFTPEYYAHRFSASVSHVSQAGATNVARSLWVGLPFSHYYVYPSWVPYF